ncbi:MAG TPA: M20/M25/M40 family metallo-hydrolase [Aggregatilineales bacterium]|nr:M20/M25/M40 family metallo-hydrolase [Aggregatilineales bacterium]
MPDFTAIDPYIADHLDETIAELSMLCAQPSVSATGEGIEACAELVAGMLRRRGLTVEVHPTPGSPILYAEGGSGAKTLLFYNHYDVQPPEPLELWVSPPFQPTIRDGKMYARGVSDDKGHIICRLAALDAIRAVTGSYPCRVKFIIEGEEETSSAHLPGFVHDHAEKLKADGCVWEYGGVNFAGRPLQSLGMRGICYVELHAQTADQDAHSGLGGSIFPNAAWRLIWALNALKDRDENILIPGFYDAVKAPTARDLEMLAALPDDSEDMKARFGLKQGFLEGLTGGTDLRAREVFQPTCTICGLTSGYQGPGSKTVLPAKASAKVDFRLVPDQDPNDILSKLRKHLDAQGFQDIAIESHGGGRPGRTNPDDPFVKMAREAARQVYGMEPIVRPMVGGSGPNAAFIDALHVPIVSAGIADPGDQLHAPNENIVLDNLLMGIRHTARIVAGLGA